MTTTEANALVLHEPQQARSISPTMLIAKPLSVSEVQQRYRIMQEFKDAVLRSEVDYGVVPGTGEKPTLLQPGAQKLCVFFGLHAEFEFVEREEDWMGERHGGEPFFRYLIRCRLMREDSQEVGQSHAEINSWESKYRWRWVDAVDVPPELDTDRIRSKASSTEEFAFAIDKGETSGKYGKPAQYWTGWRQAINDGTAMSITKTTSSGKQLPAFRMASLRYRIPNEDIFGQLNTLIKIGQKRALVGAVLNATGASEFFTQDLDDFTPVATPEYHETEVVIEETAPVQTTSPADNGQEPEPPAKPKSKSRKADTHEPRYVTLDEGKALIDYAHSRTLEGQQILDALKTDQIAYFMAYDPPVAGREMIDRYCEIEGIDQGNGDDTDQPPLLDDDAEEAKQTAVSSYEEGA